MDLEPVTVGHDHPDGDGVVSVQLRAGQAVALPRSMQKLTGERYEVVEELQTVARSLSELQDQLSEVVLDGRRVGLSWDSIGWCIGTTGDAVRKRWGSPPAPKTGPRRKSRGRS